MFQIFCFYFIFALLVSKCVLPSGNPQIWRVVPFFTFGALLYAGFDVSWYQQVMMFWQLNVFLPSVYIVCFLPINPSGSRVHRDLFVGMVQTGLLVMPLSDNGYSLWLANGWNRLMHALNGNINRTLQFLIILFILALPFGLLEYLSHGYFDFFSRWVLPLLVRIQRKALTSTPIWLWGFLVVFLFIWLLATFPLAIFIVAVGGWLHWSGGRILRALYARLLRIRQIAPEQPAPLPQEAPFTYRTPAALNFARELGQAAFPSRPVVQRIDVLGDIDTPHASPAPSFHSVAADSEVEIGRGPPFEARDVDTGHEEQD